MGRHTKSTLRDLAMSALAVQDACNLSGIVYDFAEAMSRLRELEPNKGTQFYNTHPICILYSSKIASLTGSESMRTFSHAYEHCKRLKNRNYQEEEMKPFEETETHWQTREGEVLWIFHMSDAHLRNTVNMLYRKGFNMQSAPELKTMLNEMCKRRLLM